MTIQGELSVKMDEATMFVEARVVANFAFQHLESANIFREHARDLELDPTYDPMLHFQRLRAYITGCIMSAAASLEALINELYIAHNSRLRSTFSDVEREFWGKRGVERMAPLDKYQEALERLKCRPFDVNKEPYLGAKALCDLRNALVHHKPIWDAKRVRVVQLEESLAGYFAVPPGSADFVSVKCMSAACGIWCFEIVREFLTEFDQRTHLDDDKLRGFYLMFQS